MIPQQDFFGSLNFFITTTPKLRTITAPVTTKNDDVTITDPRENAPVKNFLIKIDGFHGGVLVRVSKIIGTIKTPCQFISGHEINYSKE